MRNRILLTTFVFIAATFFLTCGELSSMQRAEGDEALKAMRKIQAATQVGVNFTKYGSLVIDAKAQVNEVLPALPDGDLKREISAAIEAYVDAAQIWSAKINDELPFGLLSPTDDGLGKVLFSKYNLTPSLGIATSADSAIQQLWAIGSKHLDAASKLFQKK